MSQRKLRGHSAVLTTLLRMYSRGLLPHVILLSGTDGIGKSMIVKELVGMVFCEGSFVEKVPCFSCKELATNTHPDFHIIQSEQGYIHLTKIIAAIRAKSEKTYAAPFRAFLLENIELLSQAAGNFLLPILENPGHDYFFLTCADISLAMPTIVSRALPIAVQDLTGADITEYLIDTGTPTDQAHTLSRLALGSIGSLVKNNPRDLRKHLLDFWNLVPTLQTIQIDSLWKALKERVSYKDFLDYSILLFIDLNLIDNGAAHYFYCGCEATLRQLFLNWYYTKTTKILSFLRSCQNLVHQHINDELHFRTLCLETKFLLR